jgi:hypothetical protein
VTTKGRPLVLLVLMAACAGRSEQAAPASERPRSVGGEAGAQTVASTGGTAESSPSAGPDQGGDSTLASAQGGAVPAPGGNSPTPSKIGSGTRYCDNYLECFELDCVAPVSGLRTVCIASCEADPDCQLDEVCLQSADLEPGCYERCDFSVGCYNGFDCFDFSKTHETPVCFPTGWASYWQAHRL